MLVYVTNECSTANNRHFGAHLAHIMLPHLTQPLHTSPPLANPPIPSLGQCSVLEMVNCERKKPSQKKE